MFSQNNKIKLFEEKEKEAERIKNEEQKKLEKINKKKHTSNSKEKIKKDKVPFYLHVGKGIAFIIRMLVTVIVSILDSIQWIFASAVVTVAGATILHFAGMKVWMLSDFIEKFIVK